MEREIKVIRVPIPKWNFGGYILRVLESLPEETPWVVTFAADRSLAALIEVEGRMPVEVVGK